MFVVQQGSQFLMGFQHDPVRWAHFPANFTPDFRQAHIYLDRKQAEGACKDAAKQGHECAVATIRLICE